MRSLNKSLIFYAVVTAIALVIVGTAEANPRHHQEQYPQQRPQYQHHDRGNWIAPLIIGGLGAYIIHENYAPLYIPPPVYVPPPVYYLPPPVYYPQPRIYYPPRMNYAPAEHVDYFTACAQFSDIPWVYSNCVRDIIEAGDAADTFRRRR